jgi:hypothetical protein
MGDSQPMKSTRFPIVGLPCLPSPRSAPLSPFPSRFCRGQDMMVEVKRLYRLRAPVGVIAQFQVSRGTSPVNIDLALVAEPRRRAGNLTLQSHNKTLYRTFITSQVPPEDLRSESEPIVCRSLVKLSSIGSNLLCQDHPEPLEKPER